MERWIRAGQTHERTADPFATPSWATGPPPNSGTESSGLVGCASPFQHRFRHILNQSLRPEPRLCRSLWDESGDRCPSGFSTHE